MGKQQPTPTPAPRKGKPDPGLGLESVRPSGGGGDSAFFYFFGFVITALGTAFSFAPEYSWRLTKIAREVQALGIDNGTLIVGGLILFGMGLLARRRAPQAPTHVVSSRNAETESEKHEEFRLMMDQMSTRVGQLRTSILQIAEDLATVAEGQQVFFQKQENARAAAAQTQSAPQDGLFRLAASLDKLNAYVDERIHGLDLQLRSGLDSVVHAVHQTRHSLESRLGNGYMPQESPEDTFGSGSGELDLQVLVDLEGPPAARPSASSRQPFAHDPTADFLSAMEQLEPGHSSPNRGSGGAGPLPSRQQHLDPLDALLPDDPMPPGYRQG